MTPSSLWSRRLLIRTCAAVGLAASLWPASAAQAEEKFDVVVYGATPAGVCAATAAARSGAKTALVEPLPMVGGVMSSGLSFSDSNQTDRRTLGGLFEEIHQRIEAYYREKGVALTYDVSVKDSRPWTYEPHVAEKVFNDLLKEAGVKVFVKHQLRSAEKSGERIERLVTDRETFAGKVFIDATYEGDLLPAAKVSSALGRESKERYGESLAGQQFPKQKQTFSPRDDQGRLLPLLTGEQLGPDEGDGKVMVYSWRLCMTSDPALRVPVKKPATYDPKRFELARRLYAANPKTPMVVGLDLYPLPGGKVDVNNGIARQLSMGLMGAQWGWCDASPAEREKIWQAHKDYTLELLWFLANDPGVPDKIREQFAALGFAKDEFASTDNWPPALYVREGRRMIGEYVFTQADVLQKITKPDAIAISSFPVDSHDCQRVALPDGGWLNEGTIFPVHMKGLPKGIRYGQPHQIPYRSITPKRAECTNLLVPVGLSCTHVAYSSIRVEPTWITIGHSAGIAAALSAKKGGAVQDLEIPELQQRLREAKQILDLLPEHLAAVGLQ